MQQCVCHSAMPLHQHLPLQLPLGNKHLLLLLLLQPLQAAQAPNYPTVTPTGSVASFREQALSSTLTTMAIALFMPNGCCGRAGGGAAHKLRCGVSEAHAQVRDSGRKEQPLPCGEAGPECAPPVVYLPSRARSPVAPASRCRHVAGGGRRDRRRAKTPAGRRITCPATPDPRPRAAARET